MNVTKIVLPILLLALCHLRATTGHGMLMDPVNRSSAWRKGFRLTRNYNDNELNCGGGFDHDPLYGGKCGVCGDPYSVPPPRPNENGGIFGSGIIVKRYKAGELIPIDFVLQANHKGYVEFSLCPLKNENDRETEECFNRYPLKLKDGNFQLQVKSGKQFKTKLHLPQGLTCKHCVLRWHYRAGNNWGFCPNGTSGLGCGPQEIFRGCSDIAIS